MDIFQQPWTVHVQCLYISWYVTVNKPVLSYLLLCLLPQDHVNSTIHWNIIYQHILILTRHFPNISISWHIYVSWNIHILAHLYPGTLLSWQNYFLTYLYPDAFISFYRIYICNPEIFTSSWHINILASPIPSVCRSDIPRGHVLTYSSRIYEYVSIYCILCPTSPLNQNKTFPCHVFVHPKLGGESWLKRIWKYLQTIDWIIKYTSPAYQRLSGGNGPSLTISSKTYK